MEISPEEESRVRIVVDVENGARCEVDNPELVERLLSPQESEHRVLAAASTPLIFSQKVTVSLLVVGFVLVEAYFAGVSFRGWFEERHQLPPRELPPKDGQTPLAPLSQFGLVSWGKLVPSSSGTVKDLSTPEPVEDFEGGLNLLLAPARNTYAFVDSFTTHSEDALPELTTPMDMVDRTSSNPILTEERSSSLLGDGD